MILDTTLQLANALALPVDTTTYTQAAPYMGSIYLDTVAIEDWGMGNDIWLLLRINTTVTGAASSTVQFSLVAGSTTAKVTNGGTPDATLLLAPNAAIAQANFATKATANTEIAKIHLQRGYAYRYISVAVITDNSGGHALTAGKIDSWLLNTGLTDNTSYAAGYTVK